jgi:aspartyl/glutamyl-tRNA(Asn/Gln) amidotransferase C subunit
MSITLDDIKKLADMSRIDMSLEEMEGIAKDFGPILDYVDQIRKAKEMLQNVGSGLSRKDLTNVLREDVYDDARSDFSSDIIKNMPEKEDRYLKVAKIL